MESLGIIGSGVTALGAAYYLRDRFDIEIFEKNDYVGGHTNTIVVDDDGSPLPVDTGFIVYNEVTYPNLTRLFADLKVETIESNMSFGMHNLDTGLQFCGRNLDGIFAQKKNLLSARFWKLVLAANRFNTTAPAHLESGLAEGALGDYLARQGYDDYFVRNYITPMGSAVWSTPIEKMLEFPAASLIRFFHNHGFLGLNTQLQWRTTRGGSFQYVKRILAALRRPVRTGEAALSVSRTAGGKVRVRTARGEYEFDRVLIAAHGDQALALLDSPTALERELLSAYRYERNTAILHTDESVLPPLRKIWSSWNYKARTDPDGTTRTSTVYWMNLLQALPTKRNYFVSINDFEAVDPAKIIRSIEYEHPLFDARAVQLQSRLSELNSGPIYFAGSYFRHGFHEDALTAGLRAAERITNDTLKLVAV